MSGWDFYPPSRPRRVDGGIKARSARGAIGESWWSRRFLAVLESFALGSRLTRGRSYARAGQVLTLDVAPGLVTAAVQGSRPKPYLVRIGLAAFDARTWAAVERRLAGQALFSARLLAGEMPPEIEGVFAAAKAPLFPRKLRELRLSCSCPDVAVPCKHLAATFYLLAEAFDEDPFQILHWRGRDREALLGRLRELRAGADAAGPADEAARSEPVTAGPTGAGRIGAGAALAEVTSPALAETVDRFWLPPVPLPPRQPALETEPDLLLRQLPAPGPGLGGERLVERLRPWYRRFGDRP
jgi:uncharacterized Zn finger protein